jgi:hypothetical protein
LSISLFDGSHQQEKLQNPLDYLPTYKDVTYDKSLGCGECVAAGYNFCWKSVKVGEILDDKEYPEYNKFSSKTESICCKNEKDYGNCQDIVLGNKASTRNWVCSSSYDSRTYGLHVCPFKKSSCGSRNHIEFYNIEDDGALHINNLKKGEACTYNFESVCGAPSFQINNSTDVSVFFTEWQQDKIKTEAPVTGLP